jgi:hypothetical protein
VYRDKDGHSWRIGGDAEIAWIREYTDNSRAITCAIPPQFPAYATLQQPGSGDHDPQSWFENRERHDAGVLTVLTENTLAQPWWLGYLDTGGADVIFYHVPKVSLFPTHEYVVIEAGPAQAGAWRATWNRWKGILPDLIFPADRSWLLSTLWDADWTCIGGPTELIDAFLAHPDLGHRTEKVDLSTTDMTPPVRTTI